MVLRVAHSAVGGELLVLWDGVIVGHSGSQIAVLDDVFGEPTDPTLQGHRGVDDTVQPRPEEAKAAATVCERLDAATRDFEGFDELAVQSSGQQRCGAFSAKPCDPFSALKFSIGCGTNFTSHLFVYRLEI